MTTRKVAEHDKLRKLWRICKYFKIPINDPRITELTEEQIDIMLWSELLDDPKALSKIENTYYDPDYDEALDDLDVAQNSKNETELDKILHKFSHKSHVVEENIPDDEDFIVDDSKQNTEQYTTKNDDDWEEV